MLILKILAGIVLFLALLLSLRFKLDVALYDQLLLRVGLGPVMITLSPSKKRRIDPKQFTYKKHQRRLNRDRKRALKKAEKKKRKASVAGEKTLKKEAKEKPSLEFIIALLECILQELGVFAKCVRTEIKTLEITVGGKDAAAIGKSYGVISQSVEYLIELLRLKTNLKIGKDSSVAVRADFLLEKNRFNVHIKLNFRLFSVLRMGGRILLWYIRQKIKKAGSPAPIPNENEERTANAQT